MEQASTLTLARWPGTLFGAAGPVRATTFHILLAQWAIIVSDHFYTISHSNRTLFQSLVLAIHPGATIKHNLYIMCFCAVASYSCHLVVICMGLISPHGVATSDDGQTFCEARTLRMPIFY